MESLIVAYQIYEGNLCQQNQWKSILELLVHRLVAPHLHAQQCADSASDDCKHQQSCFRYAPASLLRFPLINTVHEKCNDINKYQIIWKYVVSHLHVLVWLLAVVSLPCTFGDFHIGEYGCKG